MKRYSWSTDFMEWWDDGDYVLYSEHEEEVTRLRAEVEEYRKDAERWRFARKLLRVEEIETAAYSLSRSGGHTYEEFNIQADKAIDAAMGARA